MNTSKQQVKKRKEPRFIMEGTILMNNPVARTKVKHLIISEPKSDNLFLGILIGSMFR